MSTKEYIYEAVIEFAVDGKPVKFKVEHNCPDVPGLSINNALTNWIPRAKEFSGKDFARYIRSKGFNCKVTQETEHIYKAEFITIPLQIPKKKKKNEKSR